MNWREFFKLTIGKVILLIILFGFFSVFLGNPYVFSLCDPCGCYNSWGYPIHFAEETAIGANILNYFRNNKLGCE